jgi:hypothetical protein
MFIRVAVATAGVVLGAGLAAADGGRALKVIESPAGPAVESVTVYKAGETAGKAKPVATITKFGEAAALTVEGPFDVYAKPKDGQAVRVAAKLAVKPNATHELKLADVLGSVTVFGDNLPRAEKVVLTAPDDPGPGEKGHAAVQAATDYRVEMVAPEGLYAVWVVPANGARPQKVEDKVRVHAGRTARVGG